MVRDRLRRTALGLLSAAALCLPGDDVAAQAKHYFYYLHDGHSYPSGHLMPGGATGYQRGTDGTIERRYAAGDEVCVRIVNGNPAFYGYSLSRSVDTVGYVLPDLGDPLKLLSPLVKQATEALNAQETLKMELEAKAAERKARELAGDSPVSSDDATALRNTVPVTLGTIAWYVDSLQTLTSEIEAARSIVLRSDQSEAPTELDADPTKLSAGFRWARHSLEAGFSARPGHLGDAHLRETLLTWGDSAIGLVQKQPDLKSIATALRAYGNVLVDERDVVRKPFLDASASPEACATVGSGTTLLSLKMAKKQTSIPLRRETGTDSTFVIRINPPYARPLVAVHPIAFGSFAGDVPQFRVENGVLSGPRDDEAGYRVGAMINVNLLSIGPRDLVGVGLGLGVGTGGADNALSDVFIAAVVSVTDALRLGIGYGVSDFPSSVRGGTVGQPFDPGTVKLDELIETSSRRAFQIIMVLPGLDIK